MKTQFNPDYDSAKLLTMLSERGVDYADNAIAGVFRDKLYVREGKSKTVVMQDDFVGSRILGGFLPDCRWTLFDFLASLIKSHLRPKNTAASFSKTLCLWSKRGGITKRDWPLNVGAHFPHSSALSIFTTLPCQFLSHL